MRKQTTGKPESSSAVWDYLEDLVRVKVREFIQSLLEDEITEFLGRGKSKRRAALDAPPAYRNGYGKRRNLTLGCGTISVRRPRVRGLAERFKSRILPLFARRTKEINELLPQLYLHGLAQGDFDLALRGLLGEGAPISASTVARLKERWQAEWEEWRRRNLQGLRLVYMWVDGVYIKAGLEKTKAALLVAIGALSDGKKVILAVEPGYRESTESWADMLRSLKGRGLNCPRLVVGDGHLGIWGALSEVFPDAMEQRCWNHKMRNVLDKLPKKAQGNAKAELQGIVYSVDRQEAETRRNDFIQWCRKEGHDRAATALEQDWERMVTFYRFPKEHWKHLRTTNVVESPFAALRLRTDAAKRFKKVANATAVTWKMLLIAEKRFRKLDAPESMQEVYLSVNNLEPGELKQEKELAVA
ncbi:MAG: IS256 family transposase [Dehalococcoidales bacterium]|nr:IS256 family transposase [Dehalococcoidales bacterium]